MPVRSEAHRALGTAIRDLRAEVKLSQEALAHKAGVDRSYMGSVERGQRNVAFENLIRIADALGVQGSSLLEHAERLGAGVATLPAKASAET